MGLVFSISNLFTKKSSQANKWMSFRYSNSALRGDQKAPTLTNCGHISLAEIYHIFRLVSVDEVGAFLRTWASDLKHPEKERTLLDLTLL